MLTPENVQSAAQTVYSTLKDTCPDSMDMMAVLSMLQILIQVENRIEEATTQRIPVSPFGRN